VAGRTVGHYKDEEDGTTPIPNQPPHRGRERFSMSNKRGRKAKNTEAVVNTGIETLAQPTTPETTQTVDTPAPDAQPQPDAPTTPAPEAPKAEKLTDEQKAIKKAKENMAKYPHALADTVRRDTKSNKMLVDVKCVKTGVIFTVYTSDVFQSKLCPAAREQAKKDAKKAAREETAKALAFYRAQQQGQPANS
jgi:hypothetical protein